MQLVVVIAPVATRSIEMPCAIAIILVPSWRRESYRLVYSREWRGVALTINQPTLSYDILLTHTFHLTSIYPTTATTTTGGQHTHTPTFGKKQQQQHLKAVYTHTTHTEREKSRAEDTFKTVDFIFLVIFFFLLWKRVFCLIGMRQAAAAVLLPLLLRHLLCCFSSSNDIYLLVFPHPLPARPVCASVSVRGSYNEFRFYCFNKCFESVSN